MNVFVGTADHQVPSGSPESHQAMIVSVVISVVSVLLFAAAVWWWYRERKKRSQQQENPAPLEERIVDVVCVYLGLELVIVTRLLVL